MCDGLCAACVAGSTSTTARRISRAREKKPSFFVAATGAVADADADADVRGDVERGDVEPDDAALGTDSVVLAVDS